MTDNNWNCIIVGSGVAGLSAAVALKESNPDLTVLCIERGSVDGMPGNTRWSGSYFRAEASKELAPGFFDDFVSFTDGELDHEYVRALEEEGEAGLQWLESMGCSFALEPMFFLTSQRPRLSVHGGGAAIVTALLERADELGVKVRYESRAIGAERAPTGALTVTVEHGGATEELSCDDLVLASGSFQGNKELISEHLGEHLRDIVPVAPGPRSNEGDGLSIGLALGGGTAGEEAGYHCEPIDPRSPLAHAINFLYPYGILVNQDGERFVDEAEGAVDAFYEGVVVQIGLQPGSRAYLIADRSIFDIPDWRRAIYTEEPPLEASSIPELARQLDIAPDALERTISGFNEATSDAWGAAYDPLKLDGVETTGLHPAKSNWAKPLNTEQLVAYPLVPALVFPFFGLRVDAQGRLLSESGEIVPNVYAAGELTGLYRGKYVGATSVLRGVVFARRIGETIGAGR